jgi:hypothetical protein
MVGVFFESFWTNCQKKKSFQSNTWQKCQKVRVFKWKLGNLFLQLLEKTF